MHTDASLEKPAGRAGKRADSPAKRPARAATGAAATAPASKASPVRKRPIAAMPRKAANPFNDSPAEIRAFAVKAGIITPAGKLTASYK